MIVLKEEVELWKQNSKWQVDYEGLFGLLKTNSSEDENQTGNRFDRIEFNCGAIQFLQTTDELFLVTKSRHFNFFESIVEANKQQEAESIPLADFELGTEKKVKKLLVK